MPIHESSLHHEYQTAINNPLLTGEVKEFSNISKISKSSCPQLLSRKHQESQFMLSPSEVKDENMETGKMQNCTTTKFHLRCQVLSHLKTQKTTPKNHLLLLFKDILTDWRARESSSFDMSRRYNAKADIIKNSVANPGFLPLFSLGREEKSSGQISTEFLLKTRAFISTVMLL